LISHSFRASGERKGALSDLLWTSWMLFANKSAKCLAGNLARNIFYCKTCLWEEQLRILWRLQV
jgi:hypothetical protein